jgi:alkylation response protein AidB-like acyl-CoA dehydrogenase
VPRALGGTELDPVSILETVEQLSWADGSAGWTALIGNAVSFFAWLDPVVAKTMLSDTPDPASTGVFAPNGRGVPTADGEHFVLHGRWPANSGCLHADWFQTGFHVMDGDEPATRPDGRPDWRFAYYRAHEAEIVDTWHTSGMRATGSHDVVAHGIRVPVEHTAMPMFDPPRVDSPLLEVGFRALTAVLLSGFPLGVARRALDEIEALAPSKQRWSREGSLADDRHAQLEIGRAEAALLSARAFAVETFGDAWDTILTHGTTRPEQRARMMLVTQQVMAAALEAVDGAHRLVGSRAVYEDDAVGRCFRDLSTARQHIVFSGDLFAEYARERITAAASAA